jgi:deoxyribonuclease V
MTIAAFDVHYIGDDIASAAAVLFSHYGASEPSTTYMQLITGVAPYVPGEFYRRELPCILSLFGQFYEPPDEIIIDGYVMLGKRPGLGGHLFNALGETIPVIGVAKTKFAGCPGFKVFRGGSTRPLYVTSAGVDVEDAAERVLMMHGDHRIPALLKLADFLARENAS